MDRYRESVVSRKKLRIQSNSKRKQRFIPILRKILL